MRANSKSVWECFLLNTLGRIGQIVAKSKSKLKWQSGLKKSDRIFRSEKKKKLIKKSYDFWTATKYFVAVKKSKE